MPSGFTDKEKEKIEKGLIEQGKRLFSIYGLKKTTIKDITEIVGIAQGSFYKFYNSKEELYFEILDIEGQKIRKRLVKDVDLVNKKPRETISKLLLDSFSLIDKNELFKQLFSDNNYELLVRKLPEEKIKEHINMDYAVISPFIEDWQNKGIIKKVKPEAITGLLHSLFIITLHKKEIGNSVFVDTFELLVDLIVEGLVNEEE